MRRNGIAAGVAAIALALSLAGTPQVYAVDEPVTTSVSATAADVRDMLVTAALDAILIDASLARVSQNTFSVEVTEVTAAPSDWSVSVGLCGAVPETGPDLTSLDRAIDCDTNELSAATANTSPAAIDAGKQSIVDGALAATVGVEIAGITVLNACPTTTVTDDGLSGTEAPYDSVFNIVDCSGEVAGGGTYTGVYGYTGDYEIDLTDFHDTGDYLGYLVFTLNQ